MRYVGVDLHKRTLSVCVVELEGRKRTIIERRRFRCDQEEELAEYFAGLGAYTNSWSKQWPATSGSSGWSS